ncbi:MAG: kinase [Oligoflexia bacterium]|nr:kinase [Oligoflexia bacterium]
MRADVLINPKAGNADQSLITEKLKKTLFRLDLHFHSPIGLSETEKVVREASQAKSDFLIVCGGDGTLNKSLQPLMKIRREGGHVPALCAIPSGTANDLATQIGISKRVERSAYSVLNGGIRIVDILEVTANGQSAYMFTNGGLGVPAQTALKANVIRRWLKSKLQSHSDLPPVVNRGLKWILEVLKSSSSRIYELTLIKEIASWDDSRWEVEIEVPGKSKFRTHAPFILINNQPKVGGKFTPAPYTSNTDGTFNVLLIQPTEILGQARAVLGIRLGRLPDVGVCPSFESDVVRFRSTETSKPMIFFGDGEVLHRNVREVTVRCLHPGLPVVTMGEE